jgi:hypothetical protein
MIEQGQQWTDYYAPGYTALMQRWQFWSLSHWHGHAAAHITEEDKPMRLRCFARSFAPTRQPTKEEDV